MAHTRLLDAAEQRILGALMEKEQATPDHYPLTLSSLVAACNQKSNRDPVMDFGEGDVADALDRLRKDVLVWRVQGARSEKWQHCLVNRWHLTDPARAVMTLLLLRGPQTPGELRTRSARLHAFGSVQEVEETLQRLTTGDDPLVLDLGKAPGQREARWTHVMGSGDDSGVGPTTPVAVVPSGTPSVANAPVSAVASSNDVAAAEDFRVNELERTCCSP